MLKVGVRLFILFTALGAHAWAGSVLTRQFVPDDYNTPYDGGSERWVDQSGRIIDDDTAAEVLRLEAAAEKARVDREARKLLEGGARVLTENFFAGADAGEVTLRPGFAVYASTYSNGDEVTDAAVGARALELQNQRSEEARKAGVSAEAQRLLNGGRNCEGLAWHL